MVDPEVAVSIMELICSEGFLSDALYLLPRWEGVIGCHVCLRFEVSIFPSPAVQVSDGSQLCRLRQSGCD